MKPVLYKHQLLASNICSFFFLCLFFFSSVIVGAQDGGILPGETAAQDKDRPTQVTATVADNEDPSTPILVSPTDDSKLTTGKPTFVWKESTDNFGVSHYVLTINGTTKFDTIPTTATDNTDYTLTYNATTTEYSLAIKNGLSDGSYTWSITAVDLYDNSSTSVTWDFSIDTNAPKFVITEVGAVTVEITSQDTSTVPTTAIELSENTPEIKGTGESNSTVELTVTLPGGNTQEYSFEINSSGNWQVTLNTLPRDEVIYLDFVITDSFGNVSILSDVPLMIATQVIAIPLPDLPTYLYTLTFIPEPQEPILEIPIVPPEELLPPIIKKTPRQFTYYVRSHQATARELVAVIWDDFWLILVALLLLALPILKITMLSTRWWPYLSVSLFKQILWVVGWWGRQSAQGIAISVFDQSNIGFSLVVLSGKTVAGLPYKNMVLTNQHGVLPALHLPEGKFRVSMLHPLFFFPTLQKKPQHLEWNTYYTGSEFAVEKDQSDHLLILVAEPREYAQNTQSELLQQRILSLPSLSFPMLVLASAVTLGFPSIWNVLATIIYLALVTRKFIHLRSNNLVLTIVDKEKQPQKNVIVSLKDEKKRQFSLINQSNDLGMLKFRLPYAEYSCWVIDLKNPLAEGNKRTVTSIVHRSTSTYHSLVLE